MQPNHLSNFNHRFSLEIHQIRDSNPYRFMIFTQNQDHRVSIEIHQIRDSNLYRFEFFTRKKHLRFQSIPSIQSMEPIHKIHPYNPWSSVLRTIQRHNSISIHLFKPFTQAVHSYHSGNPWDGRFLLMSPI